MHMLLLPCTCCSCQRCRCLASSLFGLPDPVIDWSRVFVCDAACCDGMCLMYCQHMTCSSGAPGAPVHVLSSGSTCMQLDTSGLRAACNKLLKACRAPLSGVVAFVQGVCWCICCCVGVRLEAYRYMVTTASSRYGSLHCLHLALLSLPVPCVLCSRCQHQRVVH